MLKILLQLRLRELLAGLTKRKNRGYAKNLSYGAYLLLIAGAYVFCGYSIFRMFSDLAKPLASLNLGTLYFGYSSVIGFGLAMIGSVFAAQSQLFEAKDNDTLLSMPVRPSAILASRMITLYIQALLYEALMIVPSGLAWFISSKSFSFVHILNWIIPTLFLPMIAVTLGCLLGWVLAIASSHVQNKSYLQIGVSMVLLIGYFALFGFVTSEMDSFSAGINLLTGQTLKSIWPAYQYGLACMGNWISVLNVVLVSAIPLICAWVLISKFFLHVVNEHHHVRRKMYVEKELRVLSVRRALVWREKKRFFADGSYVLNAGLGILMAPIMTVAFLIFQGDVRSFLNNVLEIPLKNGQFAQEFSNATADIAMLAVTVIFCILTISITITAPSLSLEGKTIWHAGILPVSGLDFLLAKVDLQMMLTVPVFLVCSTVFQFFLSGSILARILLLISPVLMELLMALAGIVLNVIHPKFDWTSSQQCIKRSLPVTFCVLGGLVLIIGSAMVYFQWVMEVMSPTIYLAVCTFIMAVLCGALFAWLRTAGVRKLSGYYSL
ncbi:MAG: hypothetical protein K6A68_14005 [Clostridiales bacterium]|nr:hypothetical protein [Clostridiales bacterium]